ncbi:MAG TPA: helix-turn-helix transcriptional regulator [Actinomycetota bacterium]
MNVARRIGLDLARARKHAGLTQVELAARVGTTQSAISRAEAGRVTASPELIERIALEIGEPIHITFGGSVSRRERVRRVRVALDGYRFDPWERDPSSVEARALEAAGIEHE